MCFSTEVVSSAVIWDPSAFFPDSVVVVVPASTCMRGLFTLYMLFILTCAKEGERKGKKKEKKEKEDPISYLIFQLTTDDRLGENRKMSKKNITV